MREEGWAIWFVGLPGSGKSALTKGVQSHLREQGVDTVLLSMDERRRSYFPNPTYSAEEREKAYTMFADEAVELVCQGRNVLMDGSAYKVSMREYARQRIHRFAEVFVRCDLEEAIRREEDRPQGLVMSGVYRKALQRKETGKLFEGLGEVIGVDVEFEENPDAEFVIDNTRLDRAETLGKTLHFMDSWFTSA